MNHWTGLVLHQLASPDPAFEPTAQLTAIVTADLRLLLIRGLSCRNIAKWS